MAQGEQWPMNDFRQRLADPLDQLMEEIDNSNIDVNTAYDKFVDIMHSVTSMTIPHCGFNPYTKPYWTEKSNVHTRKKDCFVTFWSRTDAPEECIMSHMKIIKGQRQRSGNAKSGQTNYTFKTALRTNQTKRQSSFWWPPGKYSLLPQHVSIISSYVASISSLNSPET